MHIVVYALLFLSWVCALGSGKRPAFTITSVFVGVILFGAILEYIQLSVPGRFGTLIDVGLNATGAICGVIAMRALGLATARL